LTHGTATGTVVYAGTQVVAKLNGNTITTGTGVLTLAAGKTLTASNTLTLAGTDATTQTFPATSATIARTDAAQTFTGDQTLSANLVQGTAAKGFNFTANTPTAGMSSQLLNWYEEGTYTPVVTSSVGTITTYTATGFYTRTGRVVTAIFNVSIVDAGTGAGQMFVTLPFAVGVSNTIGCGAEVVTTGSMLQVQGSNGASTASVMTYAFLTTIGTGALARGSLTYFV
jgi:hypothetical protein